MVCVGGDGGELLQLFDEGGGGQLLQLGVVVCVGWDGGELLQLCVERGDGGQLLDLDVGGGSEHLLHLQQLHVVVVGGRGQLLQHGLGNG